MVNRKQKGNRRENQVCEIFEAEGWDFVTARGPWNTWDIVLFGPGTNEVILVQVSSNAWKGHAEFDRMGPHQFTAPPWVPRIQWRIDDGTGGNDPAKHRLRIFPPGGDRWVEHKDVEPDCDVICKLAGLRANDIEPEGGAA